MSDALCVYTAITGDIDDDLTPVRVPDDPSGRPVRYVCFTDRIIAAADGWTVRPLQFHASTPRVTARWHKIMSHILFPTAPYTVWHDGSHRFKVSPWELVDLALARGESFATFKHPVRDCAYDEAQTCIKLKKDSREMLSEQIKFYETKGFPAHAGLFETGCVVRKNCQSVSALNEVWFDQISTHSCRDQVALPYSLWVLPFQAVGILPGRGTESPFFHFRAHAKSGRSADVPKVSGSMQIKN